MKLQNFSKSAEIMEIIAEKEADTYSSMLGHDLASLC